MPPPPPLDDKVERRGRSSSVSAPRSAGAGGKRRSASVARTTTDDNGVDDDNDDNELGEQATKRQRKQPQQQQQPAQQQSAQPRSALRSPLGRALDVAASTSKRRVVVGIVAVHCYEVLFYCFIVCLSQKQSFFRCFIIQSSRLNWRRWFVFFLLSKPNVLLLT